MSEKSPYQLLSAVPLKSYIIAVFIIAIGWFLGQRLVAAALVNTGNIIISSMVAASSTAQGESLRHTQAFAEAKSRYTRAISVDSQNRAARWNLGRAHLAMQDYNKAANVLTSLSEYAKSNPLLYQQTITALDGAGRLDELAAFYESVPPPLLTPSTRNVIALAYLEESRKTSGRLAEVAEIRLLQMVVTLRPDDLYANYHLWRWFTQQGHIERADAFRQKLQQFSRGSIEPPDTRLRGYVAEAVPALVAEGIWSRRTALNIVSYLVWHDPDAHSTQLLLETLRKQYPQEAVWLFFLGELYQRQGRLALAEPAYRGVLELDPEYAPAYLRLGVVIEEQYNVGSPGYQASLEELACLYEWYYQLRPEDLLGSKKLAEVYRSVAHPQAGVMEDILASRTDERRFVAELLEVPVEAVELGPNLVPNGGFEEWYNENPAGWDWWGQFSHAPFNPALFVGGAEILGAYEGENMVRSNGLWIEQNDELGPARANWRINQQDDFSIKLVANKAYVVSLLYMTRGTENQDHSPFNPATIYVTARPDVLFERNYTLPSTHGAMRKVVVVGWNRSGNDVVIQPLLRLFSAGTVWFDDLAIRQVRLENVTIGDHKARFVIK